MQNKLKWKHEIASSFVKKKRKKQKSLFSFFTENTLPKTFLFLEDVSLEIRVSNSKFYLTGRDFILSHHDGAKILAQHSNMHIYYTVDNY